MTKLLKDAFEKASQLPDDLQDELAQTVLDELQWELQWDTTLAESAELLDELGARALKEFRDGNTKPKGMDAL